MKIWKLAHTSDVNANAKNRTQMWVAVDEKGTIQQTDIYAGMNTKLYTKLSNLLETNLVNKKDGNGKNIKYTEVKLKNADEKLIKLYKEFYNLISKEETNKNVTSKEETKEAISKRDRRKKVE